MYTPLKKMNMRQLAAIFDQILLANLYMYVVHVRVHVKGTLPHVHVVVL